MEKANGVTLLEQAKKYRNEENRRWIRAGHADCWGDKDNRVAFWVLEGSPARGFIIEKSTSCTRLDAQAKVIKRFVNLPGMRLAKAPGGSKAKPARRR